MVKRKSGSEAVCFRYTELRMARILSISCNVQDNMRESLSGSGGKCDLFQSSSSGYYAAALLP